MSHLCPDRQQPLELLLACGCRDYFCNHCQQLVSKARVLRLNSLTDEPDVTRKNGNAAQLLKPTTPPVLLRS
jgi:hypothetical protein